MFFMFYWVKCGFLRHANHRILVLIRSQLLALGLYTFQLTLDHTGFFEAIEESIICNAHTLNV